MIVSGNAPDVSVCRVVPVKDEDPAHGVSPTAVACSQALPGTSGLISDWLVIDETAHNLDMETPKLEDEQTRKVEGKDASQPENKETLDSEKEIQDPKNEEIQEPKKEEPVNPHNEKIQRTLPDKLSAHIQLSANRRFGHLVRMLDIVLHG